MKNIVATTMTTLVTFVTAYLFILLCWMMIHRYAYLMWSVVLGVPAFNSDPQN